MLFAKLAKSDSLVRSVAGRVFLPLADFKVIPRALPPVMRMLYRELND